MHFTFDMPITGRDVIFQCFKKEARFECNRINEDEYDLMFTHSEASD